MSATTHQAFTTSTLPGVSPLEPAETHQESSLAAARLVAVDNYEGVEVAHIRFPWYEPERGFIVGAQKTLFDGGVDPVRFHSGASAVWDFKGFALAGAPVGIAATAVSRSMRSRMLELVGQYTERGGKVFVDSGAFGAFVSGKSLDFERDVFPFYDALTACTSKPEQLYLVMPDVVGDPVSSMALQLRHRGRIASWIQKGVRPIFPLHSPSDKRFLDVVQAVSAGRPFSIGVPSNLAAWSAGELERFCAREQPHAIHLLGLGSDARVKALTDLVGSVSPGTTITCDSCTLLAHVGRGRRLTDRCATRLSDAVSWILNDPSAETPFDDLSTYMVDVLWTPHHLSDEEVRGVARHLSVDPGLLLRASHTDGLMDALAHLDPDEEWLHASLAAYIRDQVYGPKLVAKLRGPIRAWEVARLACSHDPKTRENFS